VLGADGVEQRPLISGRRTVRVRLLGCGHRGRPPGGSATVDDAVQAAAMEPSSPAR
jgi:hypothetical protein